MGQKETCLWLCSMILVIARELKKHKMKVTVIVIGACLLINSKKVGKETREISDQRKN